MYCWDPSGFLGNCVGLRVGGGNPGRRPGLNMNMIWTARAKFAMFAQYAIAFAFGEKVAVCLSAGIAFGQTHHKQGH